MIFGLMAKLPKPVFRVALKNFTAGGDGFPAGMAIEYAMVFAGSVHVLLLVHDAIGTLRIEEEIFEPSPELEVNRVDVMVKFQPAPEPVASTTVRGSR